MRGRIILAALAGCLACALLLYSPGIVARGAPRGSAGASALSTLEARLASMELRQANVARAQKVLHQQVRRAMPAAAANATDATDADAARMRMQCELWARWLRAKVAPRGAPCNFVSTESPQSLFVLPSHNDSAFSKAPFQPARNANPHRDLELLRTDAWLLGAGPIPTLKQYMSLLRKARRTVHLVQVGANVGGGEYNEWVHQVLEANRAWTATVVEPVPFLFDELRKNYAPLGERVEPMEYAVAPTTGPCEMHVPADPKTKRKMQLQVGTLALGDQLQGTRCFTKDRDCNFFRGVLKQRELVKATVRCIRFDELLRLRRHQAPVDILTIDTEMFDYTLIRSIDLQAFRPLAIEFESKTMTRQQGAEIGARLALLGYLCRFEPWMTFRATGGGTWTNDMEDRPAAFDDADSRDAKYGALDAAGEDVYAETVCYRMV